MTHLFNSQNTAKIVLYYGVLSLSMGSIFVRWIGSELSPHAIVFNRFILGMILFGLWDIIQRLFQITQGKPSDPKRATQSHSDLAYAIGAGIAFALSLNLLVLSISQTNIATAAILHNLSPIFTGLGLWIVFGQTLSVKFSIGMGMAIVGMGLVEWGEFQTAPDALWGDAAALLSSIFLAVYFICIEQTRLKFSAVTVQLWVCGSGALTLLPWSIVAQDRFFPTSFQGWLIVFALTFTCQFAGHGMLTYSLERVSSVLVSLVHLLEPVFSGIFAWFIFQESLSFFHFGGLIVILIGLCLSIISHSDSSSENSA